MKNHITLLFAASTLFLVGCSTPQHFTQSGPSQTLEPENPGTPNQRHITQWEFKTAIDNDASEANLCKLGEQGWDVISFNPYAGPDGSRHIICLLKRPKQ
jgi:PBP1b-binding outer membrane lipoprotein LpoB